MDEDIAEEGRKRTTGRVRAGAGYGIGGKGSVVGGGRDDGEEVGGEFSHSPRPPTSRKSMSMRGI